MNEIENEDEIVVYTDGGCSGNPGPGGWACVIIYGDKEINLSGGEKLTTNNKMELTAAINALQRISIDSTLKSKKVNLYIDSQYVKNGITSWILKWKTNGWQTANKKPVLNQDLWETLDALNNSLSVNWNWVKGHAGIKYNEICDSLCQAEIKKNM